VKKSEPMCESERKECRSAGQTPGACRQVRAGGVNNVRDRQGSVNQLPC
jgi:hypothetical protein